MTIDAIGVVGGGRWARVTITVLAGLLDARTRILVASPRNAAGMGAWLDERGLAMRSEVYGNLSDMLDAGIDAAIVANTARDHAGTATALLRAGVPCLVEKPFALSAKEAQDLVALARNGKVRLAPALVLCFADFVAAFFAVIAGALPGTVSVLWTDPESETRYGERKSYDASVTVLTDVLPHVVAMLRSVGLDGALTFNDLNIERGGAHVALKAKCATHDCTIALARNAERRQRRLTLENPADRFDLDFTEEPATITHNGRVVPPADRSTGRRPLTNLLSAFIDAVQNRVDDERLRPEIAVDICRIVDDLLPRYRAAQRSWLMAQPSDAPPDASIRYAARELVSEQFPDIAFDATTENAALASLSKWKAAGGHDAPFDAAWRQTLKSSRSSG